MRMRPLLIVAMLALGAGVGLGYAYLTSHGLGARGAKPSALEAFVARRLRALATPRGVRRLRNPVAATPLAVAEGRDHFADHCALCHGNDGAGHTTINGGLYPPAPDLREADTQALSDGELLSIIADGIRYTGMPGWGGGADDDENWKLVVFVRHLPELSPRELELMREVNHADE